ncbi:MAG: hypothetical protein OHK0038_27560 [Flammeovirgaceae bacterium]
MKKLIFIPLLFALFSLVNLAQAQIYHVYDGSTFSVMFTCNDDNQISSLQFSHGGKWHDFEVTGYADFEDTSEGGFIFYCVDGKGDAYAIDYYRDKNQIIVHAMDSDGNYTGTDWTLKRRKE